MTARQLAEPISDEDLNDLRAALRDQHQEWTLYVSTIKGLIARLDEAEQAAEAEANERRRAHEARCGWLEPCPHQYSTTCEQYRRQGLRCQDCPSTTTLKSE